MQIELSPAVQEVWESLAEITLDYKGITNYRTEYAGYRFINVLFRRRADQLITTAKQLRTDADAVIDAVRGAEPRPVLPKNPEPGDKPVYPEWFEATPPYEYNNFSYLNNTDSGYFSTSISDSQQLQLSPTPIYPIYPIQPINPIIIKPPIKPPFPPPPAPLPGWWYEGAELYQMVLRGDVYLTTPIEAYNGPQVGAWLASMFFGTALLVALNSTWEDSENYGYAVAQTVRDALNTGGPRR